MTTSKLALRLSGRLFLIANAALLIGPLALRSHADILYVANAGNNTIERFSAAGGDLGTFATNPVYGAAPFGLAFDSDADLYVAYPNLNTNMVKFSASGTYLFNFGWPELSFGQGIAFDSAENLYVADAANDIIERFSAAGTDLGPFASGLSQPRGIAFDGAGNLYVANSLDNSIEKFSPSGADLGVFANSSSARLNNPFGLAFDGFGNLYVANLALKEIEEFSPTGADLGTFASTAASPEGLAFDSAGNLYVACQGGPVIEKFTPGGAGSTFASGGGLSGPTFLAFTDDAGNPLPLPPIARPPLQWNIVWDDEFNQPDGSSPNPTNWTFDIGSDCPDNCGWGNNELEYYTSRTNNAYVSGGLLHIVAQNESYDGYNYTSARLKTQGLWSWTYGRIEARIEIPRGQGIWPAFWMLGTNINSVGWPTCGEIDIMENIGKTSDQGTDHGTIHGPVSGGGDYNNNSGVGGTYTLPGGAALADDFHIYAVQWTPNQIQWFLDTNLFFTATPASLPSGGMWVFTNSQFLLLNVAVGGNWPGDPDGTTVFPQEMLVDYVRVYQQTVPLAISAVKQPDGSLSLSWPTSIVCHLQVQSSSLAGSWSDVSNATNPYVVVPDPSQTAVFYRLESP